MYERRLLFVWVAGEEIAQVLPDSWGKAATIALIDAREDRYASAIDEIVAYIEEGPSITAHMQEEPAEILAEPRNPYKGLRAFTQDDTADFFGRETLIEEMVETTKEMLTVKQPAAMSVRLLTLTGPSGSGKSSVVMAGLLPRLQSGALSGSEAWSYLVMVPGQHPIGAHPGSSPAHAQPHGYPGGFRRRFLTWFAPASNSVENKARPKARPAGRPVRGGLCPDSDRRGEAAFH